MKRSFWSILMLIFLAAAFAAPVFADSQAQATQSRVVVLNFNGPLTPVWEGYLARGIDQAQNLKADLIVIELNTPGGSLDLMEKLVSQIRESPVPILVYVTPEGAMAGSAGTMLTLAGHLAAMTPGTAIGAASPVDISGGDISTTEATKTKEIMKALVRSLTSQRSAEATALAEATIESAKAASADEALKAGLVDYIAPSLEKLLPMVNGAQVQINNTNITLNTLNPAYYPSNMTFIEDILGALTNPNIVFLLLAIGVQAILIELSHPGGWVAGFVGVVFLALAALSLGFLPVNWFGLVIILTSFVLFVLDIKAPTHGALTAVGTGTFIAGALVLFNSARAPSYVHVSVPLVVGMGVFLGLTFFGLVMLAVRAMKTPVVTGRETMAGREGYATDDFEHGGIVQVAGEQWSALPAEGEKPILKGDRVVVVEVRGVKLVVKKV
ncbi:MAG: nodulation protein NfeD [Anaerolineaceae bacterium]